MSKHAIAVAALAVVVTASCAPQPASAPPSPAPAAAVDGSAAIPFAVPEGALFVARSRRAATVYRINEGCEALGGLNPDQVFFFWTLEAATRAGFRLSDDEACR
jgi:hypothetical protein